MKKNGPGVTVTVTVTVVTAGGRKCVAWLRDIQRPVCLKSTIGGTMTATKYDD